MKRSRIPRPLRRSIAFAILLLAFGLLAKFYQRWGMGAGISAGAGNSRPTTSANAAESGCAEHFLNGRAPQLTNPELAGTDDDTLCFEGYGLYHSGRSRTPLWSAEHLTRSRLAAARQLRRENLFHEEERLPEAHRASLKDYAHSGYDRGHMSPSGDFGTASSQHESFSLANMVPQAPELNRGIWEGYESAVRHLAQERGELYVITGPLYEGAQLERVGAVLVPSSVYKVICDPARREAIAVVCENTDAQLCRTVALAEIQHRSGIEFFPSATFTAALALPPAVPHRSRHHHL